MRAVASTSPVFILLSRTNANASAPSHTRADAVASLDVDGFEPTFTMDAAPERSSTCVKRPVGAASSPPRNARGTGRARPLVAIAPRADAPSRAMATRHRGKVRARRARTMRIKMMRVVVDAEDAGRARRRRETRAMARLTLMMRDGGRARGRTTTDDDGRTRDGRATARADDLTARAMARRRVARRWEGRRGGVVDSEKAKADAIAGERLGAGTDLKRRSAPRLRR